jgi:hypothetical protein
MNAEEFQVLQTVALASLLAWASGIRLYFVVFALGLASRLHFFPLPPGLQVLEHNWVLGAAGFMLLIEFIADKVPLVDTVWDGVHTFIRIPAGALLAAGATGDSFTALTVAAGLLGGTITAGTHLTKASGRAVINTSPEPLSNWTASIAEDSAVIMGTWLALHHPVVFLALLALTLALMTWLLVKFWRGIGLMWKNLRPEPKPAPRPPAPAAGGAPQLSPPPDNPNPQTK